jgi:hypothetical protein
MKNVYDEWDALEIRRGSDTGGRSHIFSFVSALFCLSRRMLRLPVHTA